MTRTFSVFEPLNFRYGGDGSAISLTDRADHLFIPMRLSLANGISANRSVRIDTGSDDAVSDDLVKESPTRRKSVQGVGLGAGIRRLLGGTFDDCDRPIRNSQRLGSIKQRT